MDKKQEAIKLRKLGLSYNEISKKTGVPKSTLSFWLVNLSGGEAIKHNNITKAKQVWAANITAYNKNRSFVARERWVKWQEESSKTVGKLTRRELFLVGVALYWGEGYKKGNWNLIFSNSDLGMIKIMLKFFTNVCKVPKEKIKIQLQVHSFKEVGKIIGYWCKHAGLNKKQFLKSVLINSKSSKGKMNKNLPFGTLQIRVNDVMLVNKIKGWIKGLSNFNGA